MNISKETLAYLKSFAQINPSIWVNSGSTLRTMSTNKTIVASAKVPEEFPIDFGIYDLNTFLSVISLMEQPEFEFSPNHVEISAGKTKVQYRYVSKKVIVTPPEKELTIPDEALAFLLTNEDMQRVMRAAKVMSLPNIVVDTRNNELFLVATDDSNNDSNEYRIVVGETSPDEQSFTFREENLKLIEGDYEVIISSKGIAQFTGKSQDVTYFIATES